MAASARHQSALHRCREGAFPRSLRSPSFRLSRMVRAEDPAALLHHPLQRQKARRAVVSNGRYAGQATLKSYFLEEVLEPVAVIPDEVPPEQIVAPLERAADPWEAAIALLEPGVPETDMAPLDFAVFLSASARRQCTALVAAAPRAGPLGVPGGAPRSASSAWPTRRAGPRGIRWRGPPQPLRADIGRQLAPGSGAAGELPLRLVHETGAALASRCSCRRSNRRLTPSARCPRRDSLRALQEGAFLGDADKSIPVLESVAEDVFRKWEQGSSRWATPSSGA